MKIFMVVCLVSATSAQYNYRPGINHNGALAESSSNISPVSSQPLQEEYNKFFYTYSAPEQEFDDSSAGEQAANSLRKNLRVIFIKGPENTALENAVLQLAKGAADDRTAIYVLNKQSDIGSIASQLKQHIANSAVRPEVHFVKYRTQTDAENAQRAIKAQYDDLPGSSSVNGPSPATVLDFASKSASPFTINNSLTNTPIITTTTASTRGFIRNSYLPPSKRV